MRICRFARTSAFMLCIVAVPVGCGQKPESGKSGPNTVASVSEDSHSATPERITEFINPIHGSPFSATVQLTFRGRRADKSVDTRTRSVDIARNSQGWTHEVRLALPAQSDAVAPLQRTLFYTLQHTSAVFSSATQNNPDFGSPEYIDRFVNLLQTSIVIRAYSPPIKTEDIGSRTFGDIILRGVRATALSEGRPWIELWFSQELSICIMHLQDTTTRGNLCNNWDQSRRARPF